MKQIVPDNRPEKNYFYRIWLNAMTQKERRDLIRSLKKEIKAQQAVILESIECETMTPAEFAYYKRGVGDGMNLCIDILMEEE